MIKRDDLRNSSGTKQSAPVRRSSNGGNGKEQVIRLRYITSYKCITSSICVHYIFFFNWNDWVLCDFTICKKIGIEFTANIQNQRKHNCRFTFFFGKDLQQVHFHSSRLLKGFCNEDIALSCRFCAEFITYCPYPYTQCSVRELKKISNKFIQEISTIIIFWWFLPA